MLALFFQHPVKTGSHLPSVSLVISVYNEDRILKKKIENALGLDYPENLMEIAIVSDGSTDRTNDIIHSYAQRDRRIIPCIEPKNQGKTACLNDFLPKLGGEIILFSDANSFYDKDLIHKIVRPFTDESIGFVTGSTRYYSPSGSKIVEAPGLYSRIERKIKSLESKIGSCVGADGAVFAMRKALFSPMQAHDINDIVIPFQIVKQGYRGILEEETLCEEEASQAATGQLRRQVRITSRTLRAIFNHKTLLNPFRFPLFSIEIISHKLMKFTAPFFMLLFLITNILLAWRGRLVYQIILFMQIFLYFLSLAGFLRQKKMIRNRWVDFCHTFILINVAYAIGWFKYARGETYTSWTVER
ncbi:MAG: glycosyltransferase [Desulfobacterales bacterium]|nr:glycosyltransferase [Desulfobacterales bacterium]